MQPRRSAPEMDPRPPGEAVTGHVLEHVITALRLPPYRGSGPSRSAQQLMSFCVWQMATGLPVVPLGSACARSRCAVRTEAHGILVPQILLGGEEDAPDVVQRRDALGRHTGFIQTAAIELFAHRPQWRRGASAGVCSIWSCYNSAIETSM